MREIGYYADFLVFPFVLLGLAFAAHRYGGPIDRLAETAAIAAGIFVWTFLEYAIHRFILHNGLMFSQDHDEHHAAPKALIGTPTWLTFLILVVAIYLPAVVVAGLSLGLEFGFGLTLGYLCYSFAHYVLHHWNARRGSIFYHWQRIHALHHFASDDGNFGVTSNFWDHVFGTVARPKRQGRSLV
jgi:sterol desaturase/sphingolipid hydroxylase (fatty acid hydroxylase superfamily)